FEMQDTAPKDRQAGRRPLVDRGRKRLRELFGIGAVVRTDPDLAVLTHEIDRGVLAREEPLAALEDLVEDRFRIGDGTADRRQNLSGRALLLQRFVCLVEQANVLERNRRLIAEGLKQRNLALAEGPDLLAQQQDRPDRLTFPIQRGDQDRTMP